MKVIASLAICSMEFAGPAPLEAPKRRLRHDHAMLGGDAVTTRVVPVVHHAARWTRKTNRCAGVAGELSICELDSTGRDSVWGTSSTNVMSPCKVVNVPALRDEDDCDWLAPEARRLHAQSTGLSVARVRGS